MKYRGHRPFTTRPITEALFPPNMTIVPGELGGTNGAIPPADLPELSSVIRLDLRYDEKFVSLFDEKDRDFLEECVKLSYSGMTDLNHWNYNRTSFFNMIPKNLEKIVEVGVHCGKNAYRIFKVCRPQHLFLVDPWSRTQEDSNHKQNTDLKAQDSNEDCVRMFFDNEENVTIMKNWSLESADCFDDQDLDFVYIDADHDPKAVSKDIIAWSEKIRAGGFLGGHDFQKEISRALIDFLSHNKDFELVYHPHANGRFSADSSDTHSDFLLMRI